MKHKVLSRVHSFIHELRIAFNDFVPQWSLLQKLINVFPIVRSNIKYHISPKEYFQYQFAKRSDTEKEKFIGSWEHHFMVYFFNTEETIKFYQDKWKTYEKFHDFFNREIILLSENGLDEFIAFASRHKRFITKPVNGSFGDGIFLIDSDNANSQKFSELCRFYGGGDFVAEEFIEQHPDMSALHPESVNTIRIYTLRHNDDIVVFHPWMRIGRGRSVVDNASAGGIGAVIDFDSGRIVASGDKKGHAYIYETDNGITLKGYQIPLWNEVISFARELASIDPELHYAGWDVAIIQDGCSLVEVNPRAQISFQIFDERGLRYDLDKYLKQFNLFEKYYKERSCRKVK